MRTLSLLGGGRFFEVSQNGTCWKRGRIRDFRKRPLKRESGERTLQISRARSESRNQKGKKGFDQTNWGWGMRS